MRIHSNSDIFAAVALVAAKTPSMRVNSKIHKILDCIPKGGWDTYPNSIRDKRVCQTRKDMDGSKHYRLEKGTDFRGFHTSVE